MHIAYDSIRQQPALGSAYCMTNLYYLLYCPTVMHVGKLKDAVFVARGRVNGVGSVYVCISVCIQEPQSK